MPEIPFNKPFIAGKELYYIAEAVLKKDFDVVAIDTQDRRDMFRSGDPAFSSDYWSGNNPFYNAIAGIAVDEKEFDDMVAQGALVAFRTFEDSVYGITQFYQVDKGQLHEFVAARDSSD